MLYFAYGSNLNWHQMKKERCPGSKFLKSHNLKGYKLCFSHKTNHSIYGHANIIKSKKSTVLGALWKITKKNEKVLDLYEGGLFVLETVSVIIQVISFKLTGKRIFKMAPIHHHFEQKGWAESTIVIRFWIIAIILALVGLATLKLR